jgi:hypothetical protein
MGQKMERYERESETDRPEGAPLPVSKERTHILKNRENSQKKGRGKGHKQER